MRAQSTLVGLLLASGLVAMTAEPAVAFDFNRGPVAPEGYHAPRPIQHWIYKPRYTHVYHVSGSADPYAYRYSPRGYYPYYASKMWVPAEQMRYRSRYSFQGPKYKYYPAWGYPDAGYNHKHWHAENHGRHHFWQW